MAKRKASDLRRFDAADFLTSKETVAEYLATVLEENDPNALVEALGTIARAKGMGEIAINAGLGRESLYKALREGAQPRFETVQKVISALGLKLSVTVDEAA